MTEVSAGPLHIPQDAMDTLKMKIVLLKREGKESSVRMAEAEKAKAEAEERIQKAEKQIRELSKAIHTRQDISVTLYYSFMVPFKDT